MMHPKILRKCNNSKHYLRKATDSNFHMTCSLPHSSCSNLGLKESMKTLVPSERLRGGGNFFPCNPGQQLCYACVPSPCNFPAICVQLSPQPAAPPKEPESSGSAAFHDAIIDKLTEEGKSLQGFAKKLLATKVKATQCLVEAAHFIKQNIVDLLLEVDKTKEQIARAVTEEEKLRLNERHSLLIATLQKLYESLNAEDKNIELLQNQMEVLVNNMIA